LEGPELTDWVNVKAQIILCVRDGPVIPAEQIIYRFRRLTDTVAQYDGTTTIRK
jgi:hypothetical protein